MSQLFSTVLAWLGGFFIGFSVCGMVMPPKSAVENRHIHQQPHECNLARGMVNGDFSITVNGKCKDTLYIDTAAFAYIVLR